MKTLLFLQTNSNISKESIEYTLDLAKDLNAKVKFIHIHYPDIMYAASRTTNMELFQSQSNQNEYTENEIERTEAYMLELKKTGKIAAGDYFEYYTGVPEIILKSKLFKGDFDMLVIRNQYIVSPTNSYQPLKNIIKNIYCPIWVIPDHQYQGVTTALYSTDYQEQDVNGISFLLKILGKNLQKMFLVHLTDQSDFFQKIMSVGFKTYVEKRLKFDGFSSVVVNTTDNRSIPSYFEETMKKYEGNFIIALKENKNLFQKVFYRSFTTKLLKGLDDLILILHSDQIIPIQENNNDEL